MMRHRGLNTIARAFSLVEVLVAVLVLALGLLGLGAVFPAVLRQQRIATETTLGVSAKNTIAPVLANSGTFGSGGNGWTALRQHVINGQASGGDWATIEPETNDYDRLGGYDLGTAFLPLSQRLFPSPFASEAEPRFVWDMAARLTDPANAADSPLLVAVFLRPIDPGINRMLVPGSTTRERYSLASSLVDPSLPVKARRNPVSVNRLGQPTFDGSRNPGSQYSTPVVLELDGPGVPGGPFSIRSVVSGVDNTDVAATILSAAGQRFLDHDGRLYTIVSVERTGGEPTFTATPPFPVDSSGNVIFDGISGADTQVNPIILLPQVTTVDPYIFTVDP